MGHGPGDLGRDKPLSPCSVLLYKVPPFLSCVVFTPVVVLRLSWDDDDPGQVAVSTALWSSGGRPEETGQGRKGPLSTGPSWHRVVRPGPGA